MSTIEIIELVEQILESPEGQALITLILTKLNAAKLPTVN